MNENQQHKLWLFQNLTQQMCDQAKTVEVLFLDYLLHESNQLSYPANRHRLTIFRSLKARFHCCTLLKHSQLALRNPISPI